MKTQTLNSISYCFDLLSFVFQNGEIKEKVKSIYLFGSAVRGELGKKSDIDIFFDCDEKDESIVKQIADSGTVKFSSSKDYEKWKLFKFTCPFSIHAGNINNWDLKLSIASEGILLYSKRHFLNIGERSVLFSTGYPKKKKDYIRVRRILFGRDEEYYKDKGIIQSLNGKKIASNVFIVPKGEQARIIELLAREKVDFSMTEIVKIEG